MARLLLHAQKNSACASHQSTEAGCANAIPREATAVALIPQEKLQTFGEMVKTFDTLICAELKGVDDGVTVTAGDTSMPASVMDTESQNRLLNAVQAAPTG